MYNIISKRIKALRTNLCITRKDLGEYAHVSPYSIANYEVGRRMPDIETLCLIADCLGVSLDDLVGRTPPEAPMKK
ncbi:MAG: helix-turn-helix transcriptional regulator [Ruminococcus sp.]|nr:helix-turn-helix transcriptional regulator [Ruminococcus sp.]